MKLTFGHHVAGCDVHETVYKCLEKFIIISCLPYCNINIQTSNLSSSEWSNLNIKMGID